MLEKIRSTIYVALRSPVGNKLLPIRLAKGAALYVNDVVGRPLAPGEEFAERREFERSQGERASKAETAAGPASTARGEQAPIVIYHRDKYTGEVARLKQILDGEELAYSVENIEGDEAAISATLRDANGFKLPIVFIAGVAVGGRAQLANLIQSGELARLAFGKN
jgi:hypothetical protein